MWSDNETEIDFLGFQVHANLIKAVVTDSSLLPITMGIFGDWGSGKSSVMKMLERDLEGEERVATIYFNGWQFEGYDDAKSALIYAILIELADHRKLAQEVKTRFKKMVKRIDWLRVATTGYQILSPFIVSWLASQTGAQAPPVFAPASQPAQPQAEPQERLVEDIGEVDISELLKDNPANQAILGIRKFREDFTSLIAETDLDALVILVDDIDRCEPKRLVETLEAIKLFLAVPNVAFVIGADERIVRYAIAKRYETESVSAQDAPDSERRTDLVGDYVEKLIQVPYYLPRLSPSEIETFMSLLFCAQHLGEDFATIYDRFTASRAQDVTGTFGLSQIQEVADELDFEMPGGLSDELAWTHRIAPALSDILKGNPRQTKRLLNALMLRRKLSEAAHLENLSDQILVKLMLLEYLRPRLFAQLYKWQASQNGAPQEVVTLEAWALGEDAEMPEAIQQDVESGNQWSTANIRRWLSMDPLLAGVDLRNYFWITRDRVTGILSGVAKVPRHLQNILIDLLEMEADGLFPDELHAQIQQLSTDEQDILLDELEEKLKREEDKRNLLWTWTQMFKLIPMSIDRFISHLQTAPAQSFPDAFPMRVAAIARENPDVLPAITEILGNWARDARRTFGRAATEALRQLVGEAN